MSKQASQRWTSRSLDYICRAAPKSRSKATIRVMNDKTQSEHNRSALGELGRSRGGLTSKIHALVDSNGLPVRLALSAGEAHDNRLAGKLRKLTMAPGMRCRT